MGRLGGGRNDAEALFTLLLVFVSAPRLFFLLLSCYLIISYQLASCFCRHSAPPALSLPLSLSPILTPDDVECRSPCLEAPPLSLPHSLPLCASNPSYSPPLGLGFVWAARLLLDSSPGWIPHKLDMIYSAHEERRSPTLILVSRPGRVYILG